MKASFTAVKSNTEKFPESCAKLWVSWQGPCELETVTGLNTVDDTSNTKVLTQQAS